MNNVALLVIPTVALVSAAVMVPLAKKIALARGLVANPSSDRWHEGHIPLLGGLPIILTFSALVLLSPIAASHRFFSGVLLMCLLGLIDDIWPLKPLHKFGYQSLVVGLLVAFGETVHVFGSSWFDVPITAFWLLTCTNIFNLLDHMDGLCGGVAVISATAMAAVGIICGDLGLTLTALTLAASLSGFLFYNMKPASIFMGDAGALALGLTLGMLSGRCADDVTNSWWLRGGVMVFVTMVPLVDTAVVTVTRLATCQPISKGGRDHSSHRLVRLGLSERSAAISLYLLAVFGGGAGCLMAKLRPASAMSILPFAMMVPSLSALYLMDLSFSEAAPGELFASMPAIARNILRLGYQKRLAEAALDSVLIASAYFATLLVRMDFAIDDSVMVVARGQLPIILVGTYASFLICAIYRRMWHFMSVEDGARFGLAGILGGAVSEVLLYEFGMPMPLSQMVLFAAVLANFLLLTRFSFRVLSLMLGSLKTRTRRVLIAGAGLEGSTIYRNIKNLNGFNASVIGFIDEDVFKRGKRVHGCPVFGGVADLPRIHSHFGLDGIIIAPGALSAQRLSELLAFAQDHRVRVEEFSSRLTLVAVADAGSKVLEEVGSKVSEMEIEPLGSRDYAIT